MTPSLLYPASARPAEAEADGGPEFLAGDLQEPDRGTAILLTRNIRDHQHVAT